MKFLLIAINMALIVSCSWEFEQIDPHTRQGAPPQPSSSSISSSSIEQSSSSSADNSSSSSLATSSSSSSSEEQSNSSSSGESSSSSVEASSSSFSLCNDLKENQFCDERNGKAYKLVNIGTQTWMAENLNFDASDSKCYDNINTNCDTYGRLYDWETAKTACPKGWHLPSNDEWDVLIATVGKPTAGTKLRARTGWSTSSGYTVGTDDFDFSALPGGYSPYDNGFRDSGRFGFWWSATESDGNNNAWYRSMSFSGVAVNDYHIVSMVLFSVRCIKD